MRGKLLSTAILSIGLSLFATVYVYAIENLIFNGDFEEGTINHLVDEELKRLAMSWKTFGKEDKDEKEDKEEEETPCSSCEK